MVRQPAAAAPAIKSQTDRHRATLTAVEAAAGCFCRVQGRLNWNTIIKVERNDITMGTMTPLEGILETRTNINLPIWESYVAEFNHHPLNTQFCCCCVANELLLAAPSVSLSRDSNKNPVHCLPDNIYLSIRLAVWSLLYSAIREYAPFQRTRSAKRQILARMVVVVILWPHSFAIYRFQLIVKQLHKRSLLVRGKRVVRAASTWPVVPTTGNTVEGRI